MNVALTSQEIQKGIEDIVARNNAHVMEYNSLPPEVRSMMNTQVFDDIDYLLRYITALHDILAELDNERPPTFQL